MTAQSLPPQVASAIDRKCGGLQAQRIAWQRAASLALGQGCADGDLVLAIDAFASPLALEALARQSKSEPDDLAAFFEALKRRVDDSEFLLADWMGALEAALLYLERERRPTKLSTLTGYIQCSADFAASSAPGARLCDVVGQMLDEYGYDG